MPGSISGKAKAAGNDGGLWETSKRFYQRSYAGDYLGVALLVAAYILIKLFGEPFHSQFRLDDPRLQHPHAEVERVDVSMSSSLLLSRYMYLREREKHADLPLAWLLIYALLVPLVLLILWAAVTRPSTHKIHITILGLIISILLATFITDILKDAIGRPRPDLIARCKPAKGTPGNKMVSVEVCTETAHHTLHDGWRSYPSGHSSLAFAGLGWISLVLASQLHVLRPRASLMVVLSCLAPLLGAALIAVSRLEDYRHDVFDVVSGSILGFMVTYFNWRRYYPSLMAPGCEEPHAQMNEKTHSGFHRVRDEEEALARDTERYVVGGD